ncbi:MAG: PilZ domain-containing protein [Candidatus Omnitrophica bacterium]|nr:PilZ domain-containing protein [Candidatus Omnitrophota bacterium]
MEDRRKFFRFDSPVNIRYASQRNKRKWKTLTKNISREGFSLSSERRLQEEDMLKLEFDIPNDKTPVFATGMVVWARENKRGRKKSYDAGIRFTNITGTDRGRILEHAYRKWLDLNNYKVKV